MENLLKILHLEDTPADAELIARELKKAHMNCQILVVSDRAGFIKALEDFSPDVIISDHSLPSMDSFEALKLLKKSGLDVPLILVTAALSDEMAVSAIKKGAYDYLLKDRLQRLPSAIINSVEAFRREAENKAAYEHLVQNERRYRTLFENNPGPMWIIDLHTFRFLDVNNMAILQYGYTREEFLSMTALDIRPEEDLEHFKQSDHSSDAKPTEYNRGIWRHLKKDGTLLYVEIFTHNIIFEGVPARFVLSNDITEKKKAEESLRQSEKKLKEAEVIARLGNWEVDMIQGSVSWSDEMYSIFGVSSEITPSVELFLSLIHPDDSDEISRKITAAFEKFGNSFFEFRFLESGTVRYGYSKWNFVFDENKRPVRLFGIIQDITERKLAETERIKMINDLTQRNKALEQFAYIVSHNLRAPVANIQGATSLMTDPKLTAEEKDVLIRGLDKSVAGLDQVIRDLNDILQVKLGTNEIKEEVSFSKLVHDVEISIRNMSSRDNIEIRCDFSEVGGLLTLRSYLYSIFYNLISNSVKYSRQDTACIIDIKSSRVKKNKIELVFKDNGMGIDLEQHGDHVFGLYKRFHPSIEGHGIGLFMVKTQVETLGGKISIASEVNKGTEFKIEFNDE